MAKKRSGYYSHDIATAQNAATTLLANIRFASMDEPIKTIVVTSSIPNEGKTTISCHLAQAMAMSGKRALIVDCDTRNRSVAMRYNIHSKVGLFSLLSKQVSLEDAILPTGQNGLSIVDIEPSIPNPADIFASKRFHSFLNQMRDMFDFVVLDTPPVMAFVDAAVVASHADATVLVIREDFTHREEAAYACEQLRKADANLIGICMNCCSHQSGSYYGYSSYYGSSQPSAQGNDTLSYSQASRSRRTSPSTGTRFKQ